VPGAYLAGAVLIAATLPLSVVLNRLPAR
jgi:hypothetical protein